MPISTFVRLSWLSRRTRPGRTDDYPNDLEGGALLVALAHYMAERLAAGDDDQAEEAADAAFKLRGRRIFNDR
jgi:hypothetical protein